MPSPRNSWPSPSSRSRTSLANDRSAIAETPRRPHRTAVFHCPRTIVGGPTYVNCAARGPACGPPLAVQPGEEVEHEPDARLEHGDAGREAAAACARGEEA